METPDPPNDTLGALKQVVLTPQDIPRILRVGEITHWNPITNNPNFQVTVA